MTSGQVAAALNFPMLLSAFSKPVFCDLVSNSLINWSISEVGGMWFLDSALEGAPFAFNVVSFFEVQRKHLA